LMGNRVAQICSRREPAARKRLESAQSTDGVRRYTGSYGKLAGHLGACRSEGLIFESEYTELVAALDDVARHGGSKVVECRDLVDGTDVQNAHQMLNCLGFTVEHEVSVKDPRLAVEQIASAKRRSVLRLGAQHFDILSKPDFNCRLRGDIEADTQVIVYGFKEPMDFIGHYAIDVNILDACIRAIALQYGPAPYHNWLHAFDVYQFCHMALMVGEGACYLTFQDMLVVLLSSIAHDVAHPGVSAPFLIATAAPLAITYNDKSPLENMHSSVFFETLRKPGMNFLEHLKKHDFAKIRAKIIAAILATDMTNHFTLVDKLASRVAEQDENPIVQDSSKENEKKVFKKSVDDRRILVEAFVHMADLGNSLRPWDVCKAAVVALEEENFRIGELERQVGIPISPMNDRSKDSLAACQDFFLGKMVRPLCTPFMTLLNYDLASVFEQHLDLNHKTWALLIQKHGKHSASQLLALEQAEFSESSNS